MWALMMVGDLLHEHLVGIAHLLDLEGHHLLLTDLFEVLFVLDEQQDDAAVEVFQAEGLGNESVGEFVGVEFGRAVVSAVRMMIGRKVVASERRILRLI